MRFVIALCLLLAAASVSAAPDLSWSYQARGVVSGDLAGGGGLVFLGTSTGSMAGLNASTGEAAFNQTVRGAMTGSPVYADGLVYYGSDNSVVYAVNVSTGNRTWSLLAKGKVRATVAVGDGVVYAGADDGRIYAADAASGKELWSRIIGSPPQYRLVFDGGVVYATAQDRRVYAVDRNGIVRWNRTVGNVRAAQTLAGGLLFLADERTLYAVRVRDGSMAWNASLNGSVQAAPEVHGGLVYESAGKYLMAYDALSGSRAWAVNFTDAVSSAPEFWDGLMYFGAGKWAYCVNASSGEVLWSVEAAGTVKAKPVFESGTLVAASGSAVDGFGSLSDLRVEGVRVTPGMPAAGRRASGMFWAKNTGLAVADGAVYTVFLDRVNVSEEALTLAPGESRPVYFDFTPSAGGHMLEVVADYGGDVFESDEENNTGSELFFTFREWPSFHGGGDRTGFMPAYDSFGEREYWLGWSCSPHMKNLSASNLSLVWEGFRGAGCRLSDVELGLACTATPPRGSQAQKLRSNWTCRLHNVTGWSDRNFRLMNGYLEGFNESVYNLSLRHNAVYYPFNVTDYRVYFSCDSTVEEDMPVRDAGFQWDCKVRKDLKPTPYRMLSMWKCTGRYQSRYTLADIAALKGYGGQAKPARAPAMSEYRLVWNLSSGGKVEASPVAVDLDGSGDGGLETVVGSYDGFVYALRPDGSLLWRTDAGSDVLAVSAADADGDGRLEVYAGLMDGRVVCLDDRGGLLWEYRSGGPVVSAPLLENVDNTPESEVIFGSYDDYIYALTSAGSLKWKYPATEDVVSAPSAADVDRDGSLEVIVGSGDNMVYVLKAPPYKVWTYLTAGDVAAASVPVKQGSGTDLAVASGGGVFYDLMFSSSGQEDYRRVCDADGCRREGVAKTKLTPRWTLDLGSPLMSSPAYADVDGDGREEYVLGSDSGNLYVVNRSGVRLLRYSTSRPVRSSPAVADLNGDGTAEIVFGSDDGRIYVIDSEGETLLAYQTGGAVRSSPYAADIDGDGIMEFAAGSDDGRLYVFGYRPGDAGATSTTLPATTRSTTTTTPPSATTHAATSTTAEPTTTTAAETTTTVAEAPGAAGKPPARDGGRGLAYLVFAAFCILASAAILVRMRLRSGRRPKLGGP